MQKALQNLKLLRYQFFFYGWLPENLILILYFAQVLDSYALAGVVFMVRYWSIALFEIPTGYISDKFGRRRSLILSAFISLVVKLCYIAAFWICPMAMLSISSVLYGISESLNSGTDKAIIYENVRKAKKQNRTPEYEFTPNNLLTNVIFSLQYRQHTGICNVPGIGKFFMRQRSGRFTLRRHGQV